MNLNKVFLVGRLTADPQLRSTQSGMSVASFSVATNRVWTDQGGAKKEAVEFHNVVAWGKQAEVASRFLKKGGLVLVEGRLQTRDWEGKDGQKRRTTEVVVERLQLGPRSAGAVSSAAPSASKESANSDLPTVDLDDSGTGEVKAEDLPF